MRRAIQSDTNPEKDRRRGERDGFPKPKGGLTQAERVRALGVRGL